MFYEFTRDGEVLKDSYREAILRDMMGFCGVSDKLIDESIYFWCEVVKAIFTTKKGR